MYRGGSKKKKKKFENGKKSPIWPFLAHPAGGQETGMKVRFTEKI